MTFPLLQVPFSRLMALNRKEWPYLLTGIVSSAAVGGVQPGFAFLISAMTTNFFVQGMRGGSITTCVVNIRPQLQLTPVAITKNVIMHRHGGKINNLHALMACLQQPRQECTHHSPLSFLSLHPRRPGSSRVFAADPNALRGTASFYSWMFFTIACGTFIFTTLQQWSFAVMGAALSRRVRQMLFRAILRQDIG
jgi:ABC-type multidrug transport system fused ATPase/permease subunit